MIVLDTPVLVYAKGADHPLRQPCRALLSAIQAGVLRATTTAEVIQEFAHVRARRADRATAATMAKDYAELLSPLLSCSESDLVRGLAIFESTPRLSAFDSVLAGIALNAQAEHLVSADRAFADVVGLSHVFPDADGVAGVGR